MTAPTTHQLSDTEQTQARESLNRLRQGEAAALQLPEPLFRLLSEALSELADGRAVQLITLEREIGTQEAAGLLRVSRPYLVGRLEAGELPYRRVGNRRRLLLTDVLAYRRRLDRQRQDALQALADDLQDMGLA